VRRGDLVTEPHDERTTDPVPDEVLETLATAAARDFPRARDALDDAGYALFKKRRGHRYLPKESRKVANKLLTPLDNEQFAALATEVVESGRTKLGYDRLYTLYQALESVAAASPAGERVELLEVGVYRGGSSFFLAGAAARLAPQRTRLVAVDTFAGHEAVDLPEGQEGAHQPSAFADVTYEDVARYLSPFEFVEVHEGRIQDAVGTVPQRVHLAHLDVDIYAPTRFALELVADRMVPGGVVIVDDYDFKTCPGVRRAVDEFMSRRAPLFFKLAPGNGQCCLVATGPARIS
jgi:O-methyltransferase